jgi:hypothetical protein
MPAYRIHRMKDAPRQQFRWAPHTSGTTTVKPKDYDAGAVFEATSPYALWLAVRQTADAIAVGDLVEEVAAQRAEQGPQQGGDLRIFKYIGFEEARWYVPEPAPAATGQPVALP